ncbi:MAG: alpha/beta hydrolase [Bryobacteraceae bacterium]|nr:alpha/beta hydrolase [Bryobacteraceae bacterium]
MVVLLALLMAASLSAAEPFVVPLYDGVAPGTEAWTQREYEDVNPNDKAYITHNISQPSLTVYLPDPGKATGTSVIIAPGGGFHVLAMRHEGYQVAEWLRSIGVAAFVLKYRVLQKGAPVAERNETVIPMAISDGRRAVRMVREKATEWKIVADRVGILGFSAGGRVAVEVALSPEKEDRANFSIPIYAGTPSGEITPPAGAGPMFLVHATDDKGVPPEAHSLRLYSAWAKAKIPVELHVYAKGGHGFGMNKLDLPVAAWPERLREWMGAQGLLKR